MLTIVDAAQPARAFVLEAHPFFPAFGTLWPVRTAAGPAIHRRPQETARKAGVVSLQQVIAESLAHVLASNLFFSAAWSAGET